MEDNWSHDPNIPTSALEPELLNIEGSVMRAEHDLAVLRHHVQDFAFSNGFNVLNKCYSYLNAQRAWHDSVPFALQFEPNILAEDAHSAISNDIIAIERSQQLVEIYTDEEMVEMELNRLAARDLELYRKEPVPYELSRMWTEDHSEESGHAPYDLCEDS
ncbi:hypothetical protein BDY21DRAFT_376685 [Lineolata rhizophorae]|uniref:Uncharacterized protein n=1 Tax=Lineolata rhizophorae TaxID=578093 RepID=A0A6A6PAK3_9PEZI|nr:hypothetical protein BDY21DRAFT_376685 [Lineolata rhizophorae]